MTKLLFAQGVDRWIVNSERGTVTLFFRDDADRKIAIRLAGPNMAGVLHRILASIEEKPLGTASRERMTG